jgi:hypothetical protein
MLHRLAEGYQEPFVLLMSWAGYVDAEGGELSANQARALSYLGDEVSDDELTAIKAVLDAIRSKGSAFGHLAGSLDGDLADGDKAAIREHVIRLLRRADALGVTPTPLEQVMDVAGLLAIGEISLDESERRTLRKRFGSIVDTVVSKLRGFVHVRAREVWVQPDLHSLRKRFVTAHEIGHDVLPWQRDLFAYIDDESTLLPEVRIGFEREANQAAIELLAQGDALRKEADDSELTLDLLWELSSKYQISMVATARRVVEESRRPVALSLRFRGRATGRLGPPHMYCSKTFAERHAWHLMADVPPPARAAAKQARLGAQAESFQTLDLASNVVALQAESVDTNYAIVTIYTRPLPVQRLRRILKV